MTLSHLESSDRLPARPASKTSHRNSSSPAKHDRPFWKGDQDLYLTLRHRLNQLNYPQHLHADSLDLVQRLVADLVQTTASARDFKQQLEIAQNAVGVAEEQVGPLRGEMKRLTAENNQLHTYFHLMKG